MKILVTGGCGFIGGNLVRSLIQEYGDSVVNIDKLTYAGRPESLNDLASDPRYQFVEADIADAAVMRDIFQAHQPDAVIHLAAESHVDRSIDAPADFLHTNVVGVYTLLEAARTYFESLPDDRADGFRFLHVSSDEVFGSLDFDGPAFTEASRYRPRSPYAASKAAADHFVWAWGETYGLPVIITHCSNNYGAFQFPEKFIPTVIIQCLRGQVIPVYGDGAHVRDWLHVGDHVEALVMVLRRGQVGETYNIGGDNEWRNLDLARALCGELDVLVDDAPVGGFATLIELVADRPGHDLRYAMDSAKIREELGWSARRTAEGFRATALWYLEHRSWWENILAQRPLTRRGLGKAIPIPS